MDNADADGHLLPLPPAGGLGEGESDTAGTDPPLTPPPAGGN